MRRLLSILVLTSIGIAAHADTLALPTPAGTETTAPANTPSSAPASKRIVLPGRGMTMTDVEEKFGIPLKKYPEIGDPPIIRWVYPDFTVYFEYHYVINAVPSHMAPPPAETDTTPAEPEAAGSTETAPAAASAAE